MKSVQAVNDDEVRSEGNLSMAQADKIFQTQVLAAKKNGVDETNIGRRVGVSVLYSIDEGALNPLLTAAVKNFVEGMEPVPQGFKIEDGDEKRIADNFLVGDHISLRLLRAGQIKNKGQENEQAVAPDNAAITHWTTLDLKKIKKDGVDVFEIRYADSMKPTEDGKDIIPESVKAALKVGGIDKIEQKEFHSEKQEQAFCAYHANYNALKMLEIKVPDDVKDFIEQQKEFLELQLIIVEKKLSPKDLDESKKAYARIADIYLEKEAKEPPDKAARLKAEKDKIGTKQPLRMFGDVLEKIYESESIDHDKKDEFINKSKELLNAWSPSGNFSLDDIASEILKSFPHDDQKKVPERDELSEIIDKVKADSARAMKVDQAKQEEAEEKLKPKASQHPKSAENNVVAEPTPESKPTTPLANSNSGDGSAPVDGLPPAPAPKTEVKKSAAERDSSFFDMLKLFLKFVIAVALFAVPGVGPLLGIVALCAVAISERDKVKERREEAKANDNKVFAPAAAKSLASPLAQDKVQAPASKPVKEDILQQLPLDKELVSNPLCAVPAAVSEAAKAVIGSGGGAAERVDDNSHRAPLLKETVVSSRR